MSMGSNMDKDFTKVNIRVNASAAGRQSGRSAELNRGVGAAPAPLALED